MIEYIFLVVFFKGTGFNLPFSTQQNLPPKMPEFLICQEKNYTRPEITFSIIIIKVK